MHALSRRGFLMSGTALALAGVAGETFAQAGPSTARIVVGVPPGGQSDQLARALAERLRGAYAPTVLVENKPGASAQLALAAVRNGPADGSLLLLTPSSPLSLYPATFKQLPYDPEKDFAPVALLGFANHAFGVGPLVPASVRTLGDYFAWAKEHPDKAHFGSPASGSIPHLLGIAAGHFAGVPLTHVPYKGSTPGVQDMMGGQVGAMCSPLGFFLAAMGTGKVRVLAVSGERRSSFLPEVATFREQGTPLTAREWYGIFTAARTPAALNQAAAQAVEKALADGEIKALMGKFGFELAPARGEVLTRMLAADTQEWSGVVKKLGFSAIS